MKSLLINLKIFNRLSRLINKKSIWWIYSMHQNKRATPEASSILQQAHISIALHNNLLHLSMWWNFRVTLDFPFTTWRQVTTNRGLTATPEPQRWPLSTRQTMGCSTAAGWSPVADIWSRASPGRSHSFPIGPSTFPQRMMFLKIE